MKTFHHLILCLVGLSLLVSLQPAASQPRSYSCSRFKCRLPTCRGGARPKWFGPECCRYKCSRPSTRCQNVKCQLPRCQMGWTVKKSGRGCCDYRCVQEAPVLVKPRRMIGDGFSAQIRFTHTWDQLPEDVFDETSYDDFDEDSYDDFDGRF